MENENAKHPLEQPVKRNLAKLGRPMPPDTLEKVQFSLDPEFGVI